MTATQMNVEIFRNLSIIAEDENLLKRAAKYLRKLAAEKQDDTTLISEDEFFASLERGEEEFRQGKTHRMLPGESLDDFLKRIE